MDWVVGGKFYQAKYNKSQTSSHFLNVFDMSVVINRTDLYVYIYIRYFKIPIYLRRKIQILSVFVLWICINVAQAQLFNVSSSACFGGSQNEELFQASRTSDGGYLMTGLSDSQDGDINQASVFDTSNIFVVKCDSLGNKVWARIYGGNLYDKGRFGMEDSHGNYLITGTTLSNDGDVNASHLNAEVFVMKLNVDGDVVWLRTYGGNGYESSRFIRETTDGNYLVGAYSTSANGDLDTARYGSHDGWIFKTDTAGNVLWSKSYGGSATDRIRWIEPTAGGGFVFAGSTQSADYDCIGNHGDHDYWAGKVNATGDLEWSHVYGGSGPDWAYHIIPAADSTWIITGYTSSSDGDVVGYRGGTADGWIIRIDSQGNLLNQKCLGGTNTDRLFRTIKKSETEWVAVGYSGSVNYDLAGVNPGFTASFWMASLDTSLNRNWSYCIGGSLGDYAKEIIYAPYDSSFVLIGDSNSPDAIAATNHGDYDFLFVRLEPTAVSLPEPNICYTPRIYLDGPSSQLICISDKHITDIDITVYDNMGKMLFEKLDAEVFPPATQIDCPTLISGSHGILFIQMVCNDQTSVTKAAFMK